MNGSNKLEGLFVSLLTVLGLIPRLYFLNEPIGWDEAKIAAWLMNFSAQQIAGFYSNIGNHIFHTLISEVLRELFGDDLYVLRAPSLIAGLALIPAVYYAFRLFFDSRVAILTAALCASSPCMIYASTNARGYIFQAFFVILLLPATVAVCRTFSRYSVSAFVLVCFSAFYTLPTTIFIVPGLFIVALWTDKHSNESRDISRFMRCKRLFKALSITAVFVILGYGYALYNTGFGLSLGNEYLKPAMNLHSNYVFIQHQLVMLWLMMHWDLPSWIAAVSLVLFCLGIIIAFLSREKISYFALASIVFAVMAGFILVRFGPSRAQLLWVPFYYLFVSYAFVKLSGALSLFGSKHYGNMVQTGSFATILAATWIVLAIVNKDISVKGAPQNSRYPGSREFIQNFEVRRGDHFYPITTHMGYWISVLGKQRTEFQPFRVDGFIKWGGKRVVVIVLEGYSTLAEMINSFKKLLPAELPFKDFDPPKLLDEYGVVKVYELRYKGSQVESKISNLLKEPDA